MLLRRKTPEAAISCYEVMGEVQAVAEEVLPGAPVLLVGGGPAAAIRHESTRYDHENRRISPTMESSEPTIRSNGSKRDLDLIAMRILQPGEGPAAEKALLEAIGERMTVSVFGLEPRDESGAVNILKRSLFDWTSRRTVDEQGVHRYEIFPLEQTIYEPEVVYEPWAMELPTGGEIPVMPPDTTVLNYFVRPVSPRAKDQEKIGLMVNNILDHPEFRERMSSGGPLWPVRQLAHGIAQLGRDELPPDSPLLSPLTSPETIKAFQMRAAIHTQFGRYEKIVKLIGHNEAVQKAIKVTTGRK